MKFCKFCALNELLTYLELESLNIRTSSLWPACFYKCCTPPRRPQVSDTHGWRYPCTHTRRSIVSNRGKNNVRDSAQKERQPGASTASISTDFRCPICLSAVGESDCSSNSVELSQGRCLLDIQIFAPV